MTNFFNRLFGRKQKPADNTNGMVYTYPADIRTFLDRDYRKIGYDAALQFPHAENRLCLIKSIATEFRLVLQDVGQRVDAQLVQQEQLMMQSKSALRWQIFMPIPSLCNRKQRSSISAFCLLNILI